METRIAPTTPGSRDTWGRGNSKSSFAAGSSGKASSRVSGSWIVVYHKYRIERILIKVLNIHCFFYVFYSIYSDSAQGLAVAPHLPPLLGSMLPYVKLRPPEMADHSGPNLRRKHAQISNKDTSNIWYVRTDRNIVRNRLN